MICSCRGDEFLKKDGYVYYRCPRCRLFFLAETISAQKLSAFYNKDYFQPPKGKTGTYQCGYDDYAASSGFKTPFYRFLLGRIRQLEVRTVLDVGAAYGEFVRFLRQGGYDAVGIEISRFAVQKAIDLGNNVMESSLESFAENAAPVRSFDLVCLLDVFEHLYDYQSAMLALRQIVKDNGLLFIVTPNSRGLSARLLGKKWYHFLPPQHTCLFHDGNIAAFLKQHGFRVIRTEHIKKTFSVKYFLHILAGWLRMRFPTFVSERFGDVVFTFPLKDNMLIIAQKYE